MFGTLTEQQMNDLLASQVLGRIACGHDNMIYLVPVSYAYEQDTIYVRSFEGMKLNIMRQNPNVCFEADNTSDMANWQSVIAWGQFEELSGTDRKHAINVLLRRHLPLNKSSTASLGQTWPFLNADQADIAGVVFRIRITQKTGKFEQVSIPDTIPG